MEFDRTTVELLRPAADGLREALRRMDDDDVPPNLRVLADTSARRLPPPIVKRALLELDGSEWLRAETAAEAEMEVDSPADLFIRRPEGWEETLRRNRTRVEAAEEERTQFALEEELARYKARIAEMEETVRSGQQDVAEAERRIRDRLKGQIEAAERGRRAAEQRSRDEARNAARMASRAERLTAELEAAEERVETLRQMLEKERRAASVGDASPGRSWFPDDPMEIAEELDRNFRASRRAPDSPGPPPAAPEPLKLPDGMRPDRPEVVRWLIGRPARWMIDGYNVAFQVADQPDATARARLTVAAGRLATLAEAGSMVVVVFDSSVDTSSLPTNRRVRVVYVHSADDWIIEHASSGAVVVSSDRRVREASEDKGAIGVWSEALSGWIEEGGTLGSG